MRDISKDYFIQNHQAKFSPGQDIDVWIKFIEGEKLGLQCFPVTPRRGEKNPALAVDINDVSEGDVVSGVVVRVSNYGVYVDIGCEVDAFLAKRKMKISKKMYSLKPWEIQPIGSEVKAYVHEISVPDDMKLSSYKIGLTTYSPDDWDNKLPLKQEYDRDNEFSEEFSKFDSELMSESDRGALQRILDIGEDDDDEDEDEDEDEDDEFVRTKTEYLSDAEIQEISEKRQKSKLLIDDTQNYPRGGDAGASSDKKSTSSKNNGIDDGEDISTEELFEEICGNKQYITVEDVAKEWDFVAGFIADGDLSLQDLSQLFQAAGARQGKLLLYQFDTFIDLLADKLGLDEDEEEQEEDEDDDDDDEADSSKMVSMDDEEDEEDDMEILAFGETKLGNGATTTDKPASKLGLEQHYEKRSKSVELLQYVYDSVANGKPHVTLNEVLEWNFVAALLDKKVIDAATVKSLYEKCQPRPKQKLSLEQFEKFVSLLSEVDTSSIKESTGAPAVVDDEIDTDEQLTYEDAFSELSQGSKYATFESCRDWVGISELIEDEIISESQLEDFFVQAGGVSNKGKLVITNVGFEKLLDIIQPFAVAAMEAMEAGDGSENESIIDQDEVNEDDLELLRDVFARLGNGKPYVSIKDLLNWDLVMDLLVEGLLTEDTLQQKIIQFGGSIKKMDITCFDKLVDALVELYENNIVTEDE